MLRSTLLFTLALSGCKDQPADTGACETPTWFADADRDGYGTPDRASCEEEPTYVQQGGDCDDDSSAIYPGAVEECDGVDNNCDGTVDEGTGGTGVYYRDSDSDGYGLESDTISACGTPDGFVEQAGDCDDSASNVYPGADEYCDETDADCDGDLNDPESIDAGTFYTDGDRDGYGDPEDAQRLCESAAGVVGNDLDCDDTDLDIHPNAGERCNGLDDDCDEQVDEDGVDPQSWYPDDDEDGFGESGGTPVESCAQPDGYAASADDCDDADALIYPGALEVCGDGLDNDCSGDGVGCGLTGTMQLSAADRVYTGEASGDEAGFSISPGRGDHDGDGKDDLLVSAAEYNGSTGRVYLFSGPIAASGSLGAADVIIDGAASGDTAGLRVAWAGDTNSNGRDDVLIGAWREDSGATNGGAVYLLRGALSSGSVSAAPVELLGEDRNDYFGTAVAGVGDMDQDGRDDILIGACGDDGGGTDSGAVYLFYSPLSSGSASDADAVLVGTDGNDQAGYAVAGGDDLDNDGTVDALVGAVAGFGGADGSGTAYVVSGASVQSAALGDLTTLGGFAAGDYFGWSLDTLSDINGDGTGDAVVGAYNNAGGTGAAYVFFGPLTTDTVASGADVRLVGVASGDLFGFSVASAGDPNGDGALDLIVGAPEADGAVAGSGAAWLFYGPLSSGTTLAAADATLHGAGRGDAAGSSVGGVGDVSDDGVDDLFVGAYQAGTGGEIYVLFGGLP